MNDLNDYPVNSMISLTPLLNFWENNMVSKCRHMAHMFAEIKEKLSETPRLKGKIKDIRMLDEFHDILNPLMSAVFPPASFETEIAGALTPCTSEPFFVTPEFQRLFVDNDKFMKGRFRQSDTTAGEKKLLRIYALILSRIYGMDIQGVNTPMTRIVPDETTGLDRYYRIVPDFQFVHVTALQPPPELSDNDRENIAGHITDIDILKLYIDIEQFELTGFTIVRAMDMTEPAIISMLERDLVNQQSIFSSDGIRLLESRLQVLFKIPDLALGIGALQGDQVMIVKNDCPSNLNCLFANSRHINLQDIKGSIWMKTIEQGTPFRIADLKEKPDLVPAEEMAVSAGIRSMLLSPLSYQGDVIGLIEVFHGEPNYFGPIEALLLDQVVPIFSVALKRGLDELGKSVQAIIKEKCTAVHPSVEWRFEEAAIHHMERLRDGIASEMEPIIFKDVVPFYGQSDVRGSSLARNKGIQEDLTRQLNLALDIMAQSTQKSPWPILKEYKHRIKEKIETLSTGVNSSDENAVFSLLNNEITPIFDDLTGLGSRVADRINVYKNALDPVVGMIYDKRKEYEQSVSTLNETLSAYLGKEDALIQQTFPHYFERRQTDGVDYMMYIGASMMKNQKLSAFHIKNMTLWQLMIACGLGWHTAQVKSKLATPLDTCHLILINHTPLSIRFRFDEKRFDVDGAYDVRHEIIKSRLDKALIKGTQERLTQPERIAVVYTTPEEEKEIRQHVSFLMRRNKLLNDMELLELDDMPDVRGLKAVRVGINLSSRAVDNIIEMKTG